MNKIKFFKFLDRLIGKPLLLLLPKIKRYKKREPESIRRILLIRPGGIGDAVLLLPAIHLLKENFSEADVHILCEKRNADIFRLSKDIDKIYLYDKNSGLFKCLREKYDIVIDTEQWHRLSAIVAFLTGAPVRIGFNTNDRSKLFNVKIPYSHDDYEVYSFFHLIEPLLKNPLEFDVDKPFIDIDSTSFSSPSLLQKFGDNKKFVAVFPGASVPERRWGGERFGEVAKTLNDKGYGIVILGSKADSSDAEKIKEYVNDSIDLTGKTTLKEVAAILKKCSLLITADSGLMHLAYGVDTPTVSLFGSGIQKKWAPLGRKHIVLNKKLNCSPCTRFGYTPRCKKNVECIASIKVDDVVKSVERL